MWHYLGLLFLIFLVACNAKQSEQGTRSYSSTLSSGVYGVQDMDGSIEEKEDLTRKINLAESSADSLYQYQTLNRYLCERLRYLRNDCAVKNFLIPTGQETTLQCSEDDAEPSLIQRSYKVKVTAVGGLPSRLYFVANETYESSLFGEGETEISFRSVGSSSSLAPTFEEVESLLIKAEGGVNTLPDYDSVSVSFSIDGVTLFSGTVLPASSQSDSGNQYRVDLSQVLDLSQSDQCRVGGTELSQIKDVAAQYVEENPKLYNPFTDADLSLDIEEKTTLVESAIKEMEEALNLQRSRYADFLSELQASSNKGCRLEQELQNFTVQLHGSIKSQEDIAYNSKYPVTYSNQKPECMDLNMNFGSLMSWTVDQSSNALLGSTAPEFIPSLTGLNLTIGNISQVKISRDGVCIENQQIAVSETVLGFIKTGEDYNYNVFENNIFNITGVTITANDLVVYDNRDLSIVFDRNHELSWEDPFFEQNQKWLEMLQNEDCNLTQ